MPRLKRARRVHLNLNSIKNSTVSFIRRRPLWSFLGVLFLLFLVILAANTLFKQKVATTAKPQEVKQVGVYQIGQVPKVKVQAQVQKDGVIVIMAQSAGVVQKINVQEGDSIKRGTNVVSLSTNYQGGNAFSLQRQLAGVQFQNIKDTYDKQKDIIGKQKELAEQNANNTEQLRQISVQSLNDTNGLVTLNQTVLNTLNKQVNQLQATNSGGMNEEALLGVQQMQANYQAALNQLNATVRQFNYSTNTSNPPTTMTNLTKEVTLKQLEVQEKALELSKQSAGIQLSLAQVQESLMFPAAPCNGVVQKVHVSVGQLVSPGTPLVTLYAPTGNVSAIAKVPESIARSISSLEPSDIIINEQTFSTYPRFVSSQATDGQMYSIIFDIPENLQSKLTNGAYISVQVPVGETDSQAVIPFIPLDAVFQTQDESFVYVVEGEKAISRKVTLGEVLGSQVQVQDGIKDGDQIILSRNIVAGDLVKI